MIIANKFICRSMRTPAPQGRCIIPTNDICVKVDPTLRERVQAMLTQERRDIIANYLKDKQSATVIELAKLVNTSQVTIRKDLTNLEEQNLVQKVYGGAIWLGKDHLIAEEIKSDIKLVSQKQEKERIARQVVKRLHSGMTLFLDAGTTNQILAQQLLSFEHLTIITWDLEIALTLVNNLSFKVILLAGELSNITKTSRDYASVERLKQFRADIAVMSCDAFSRQGVFTTSNEKGAMKEAGMKIAERRFLVADGAKSLRRSLMAYDKIQAFDCFFTTEETDLEALRDLAGTEVVVC